jgi:uroporphyrinogen decarboxylase
MDSAALKARYGDRVTFHGAIDIQQAIFGSDEDVKNEVKRAIRSVAPGGGYILSPANHIQEGTPPENVIALYRYAKEFGKYPIDC